MTPCGVVLMSFSFSSQKFICVLCYNLISVFSYPYLLWLLKMSIIEYIRYVTQKSYIFLQTRRVGFPKQYADACAAMRGSSVPQCADCLCGNVRMLCRSIQCGRSPQMNVQAYALDRRWVLWKSQWNCAKQVFRVKKLMGLPPQLELIALALNCWLG